MKKAGKDGGKLTKEMYDPQVYPPKQDEEDAAIFYVDMHQNLGDPIEQLGRGSHNFLFVIYLIC